MTLRDSNRMRNIPATAAALFIADQKVALLRDEPDMSKLDVYRTLNNKWAEADDEIRKVYERKADYERRKEARNARMKGRNRETVIRRSLAVCAYAVFVKQEHETLKESNPEMALYERTREIAVRWKSMSEEDRAPFVKEAKRKRNRLHDRDYSTSEESE